MQSLAFGIGKKAVEVLQILRPMHEKRDPVKVENLKRSFYGKLKT